MRVFLVCVCAAKLAFAQPAPRTGRHELLNSVAWTQTAAEHDAACLAAYRNAREQLDRALKNRKWTAAVEQVSGFEKLPPAVIFDVDETVVDNSAMEARLVLDDSEYTPARWDAWVEEAAATALPGALEFTRYAASRGVSVFYVTNREAKLETATRRNLERLGFPLTPAKGPLADTVLCRDEKPEWTSDKSSRRAEVARYYRVLLLGGDDLGDFLGSVRTSVQARRDMVVKHGAYWGTKWIVLPNPMYGSWEAAVVGDPRQPRERKQELKVRALDARMGASK